MFKVQTPQTLTLTRPGDDAPSAILNFNVNGADTSRCVLELITDTGETFRAVFMTGGQLVDHSYTDGESNDDPNAPPLTAADHIVDGVDTRAFSPYTHVPPQTADTAYTAAVHPPQNRPDTPEERELREKHYADAAENAKKMREELAAKAKESPQERADRENLEREERRERAQKTLEEGYYPPEPTVTGQTFPNETTQRLVAGKKMDGSPQTNPEGEPMAPAPSSPLPGSPPPHPLDQPDPGKVNTSQSLQEKPHGEEGQGAKVTDEAAGHREPA